MDPARILAYLLDVALFAAATVAVWRRRRDPVCYTLAPAFLPWLILSLAWSVYLLTRGLLGLSGNDTLATINGYLRVFGPLAVLVWLRWGLPASCRGLGE